VVAVLVCPDSFKGSLTAAQATAAIAAGVLESGLDRAEILRCPLADGGEGSLGLIAERWDVPLEQTKTEDPLGRPHTARWAFLPDDERAVIELAEASGLPLVQDLPLRVLDAHTRGTGRLISDALSRGARSITLCLGGSATVDGGVGIAHALGARFLDGEGEELPPTPRSLGEIAAIDLSRVVPEAFEAEWSLLVDVTNPLTGPQGAAAVFGPQKGASPEEVALLEAGLASLAGLLRELTGRDASGLPGAGAAGGAALVLHAVFGAEIVGGAEHLGLLVGLPELMARADVVFTGEARLDGQSGGGKVVSHVSDLAASVAEPPPVVCLAGEVLCTPAELRGLGLTAAFSIANGAQTLEALMNEAAPGLRSVAANATRSLLALSGDRPKR
jgi:glycerate kinase